MNNKIIDINIQINTLKNEISYLKLKKLSKGLTNYECDLYNKKKNELENLECEKATNKKEYIKSLSYQA